MDGSKRQQSDKSADIQGIGDVIETEKMKKRNGINVNMKIRTEM